MEIVIKRAAFFTPLPKNRNHFMSPSLFNVWILSNTYNQKHTKYMISFARDLIICGLNKAIQSAIIISRSQENERNFVNISHLPLTKMVYNNLHQRNLYQIALFITLYHSERFFQRATQHAALRSFKKILLYLTYCEIL